ncbi:protein FAM177A1 [Prorops nasuta]|uniref:protein FAM177A1 n=1 Tax=Prorops nasuta TaxID=863751 RepID=UPI0034CD8D7D
MATCDLNNVVLQHSDTSQDNYDTNRRPRRILHFSDGDMEEYSSDNETDGGEENKLAVPIDPKTLSWIPWTWYQASWVGEKVLDGFDYMGESLASFFGITTPKYEFEINEYYRQKEIEEEAAYREDLELGGWLNRNTNNVIETVEPRTDNSKSLT